MQRFALRLGDYLGRDRDLALLTAKMGAMHLPSGTSVMTKGFKQLKRRLAKERRDLQQKAWRCSKKLFCPPPSQFVKQILRPSTPDAALPRRRPPR